MKLLKIGISGVRGIVGETLTPELIVNFACAFGTYVEGGHVVVARDPRASGAMVAPAVFSGLTSCGCDVVDLGICPTPIVQYHTRATDAAGAVSITASHNDARWNALKFFSGDGVALNAQRGEEILDIYHQRDFLRASWDSVGTVVRNGDAVEKYLADLASRFRIDESVRFKVVVDPCNGAGAGMAGRLLESLGVDYVALNDEPNGEFPHDPEPRPANMKQAAAIVSPVGADAGFVLSTDVDRVAVVDERGVALSEEYSLALVAEREMSREPGTVVTNVSTSRMTEDVVLEHGGRLLRTKVGQAHVVEEMIDENGVVGGEGSGGIAMSEFQHGFDGFAAMAAIIDLVVSRGCTLSEVVASLPKYHMVKEKIACDQEIIYSVVHQVERALSEEKLDLTDGVRVERPDGWLHVRASYTEPFIRVITESQSETTAREYADEAIRLLRSAM